MSKKQKKMLIRILVTAVMLAALYFLPVNGWLRLGLYLVKTIINSHDEDIAVRSEDGVTEFVFTLPLAERSK